MFEQAVLPAGQPGRRWWAVVIGVIGEVLLVACALIAPIIWPQYLPRPQLFTWLSLPSPPPSAVKPPPPVHVRPATRPFQMAGDKLRQPVAIPDHVAIIEDPPASSPGAAGGAITSDLAGLAIGILDQATRVAPPPRLAEPQTAQPVKPAVTGPPRRIGGQVNHARLVRRVDPIYPPLARQARISGTVELAGVIGVDGRIRELQVVNGHPLLARAALEAVRQWVYEPTLLNGEPVEVIAPITVNFLLK